MAWIEVGIVEDSFSEELFADGTVRAKASRTFYVEADTPIELDQALSATVAGGGTVAARGSQYSASRPMCTCRRRTPQRKSPYQAYVLCEYEDPTDGRPEAELLSAGARISSNNESEMVPYAVDAEGNTVANKAGDPFDEPPQRQESNTVYTIRKFVDQAKIDQIDLCLNTNNINPVTIRSRTWQTDEAWLFDANYEPVQGATSKWEATITIKCKLGGWKDEPVNAGYRALVDGVAKEIRVRDEEGRFVRPSKPWPLTESGEKGTLGGINTLEFWPYKQSAWVGVPLE